MYFLAYLRRRRYYLTVMATLTTITVTMLLTSWLTRVGWDFVQNLGADLIGTILAVALLAPLLERGELRRESVLDRFDHRAFIRHAADARYRIQIMEMWTDLLQPGYERAFHEALLHALRQGVEVRILLLNPDAPAAEQRADDLLRRIGDVVEYITTNLRSLHSFSQTLTPEVGARLEVRIYSALPPVQLYQVDEHLIVSFYPVNVISWYAAQYQTNPRSQLGAFVSAKFDELWEAANTQTLAQLLALSLEVGPEFEPRRYQVEFVIHQTICYVRGNEIVEAHARRGIGGVPVRVRTMTVTGETEISEPLFFAPLTEASEEARSVHLLFAAKYGSNERRVVLKLVDDDKEEDGD